MQDTPMNRADYLLSYIAQECCEIAIRCTKAQMFGLKEVQPGQHLTNLERLLHEFVDLVAICEVAKDEGVLVDMDGETTNRLVNDKKEKAENFSDYSRELGRLEQAGK